MPNMIHFRLPRQSLLPDVFFALDAANASSAVAREEQEMNRAARDIVETKMDWYFELTDQQWNKRIPGKINQLVTPIKMISHPKPKLNTVKLASSDSARPSNDGDLSVANT